MSQAHPTVSQRLEICKHKTENPTMSQNPLAAWARKEFGVNITQSGISLILKKRPGWRPRVRLILLQSARVLPRTRSFEEALAICVLQCQTRGVGLVKELIKVKAKNFAEC